MSLTKGYKTGKAQPVWKCCREIRIQSPNELGCVYSGYNTETNEREEWMCIKVEKDYNHSIMQRVWKKDI